MFLSKHIYRAFYKYIYSYWYPFEMISSWEFGACADQETVAPVSTLPSTAQHNPSCISEMSKCVDGGLRRISFKNSLCLCKSKNLLKTYPQLVSAITRNGDFLVLIALLVFR